MNKILKKVLVFLKISDKICRIVAITIVIIWFIFFLTKLIFGFESDFLDNVFHSFDHIFCIFYSILFFFTPSKNHKYKKLNFIAKMAFLILIFIIYLRGKIVFRIIK